MNGKAKMRKLVLIVIGTVAIAMLGGFVIVKNYPAETESVSAPNLQDIVKSARTWNAAFKSSYGENAPDFTVEDVDGRRHRLSDYRGRDVLVVFWATWCPACNMEIPHLIELRKTLAEDKLAIVAISNEPSDVLRQFVAAKNINYAVASTDVGTLPAPFSRVTSIPTTFFIDREGVIKLAAEGLVSLEETKAIMQAE